MMRSLFALLSLVACSESGFNKPTDEVDPGVGGTDPTDGDGDGFARADDCNDDDASIHPDAAELCNGLDDNCDGGTDEGVMTSYFQDSDSDGFGNETATATACEPPQGYVTDAGDCDDVNAAIHPDAQELCTPVGIDENCNGLVDDEDPEASGATTFYVDADGDGYGDPASEVLSCELLPGLTTISGDCDDTRADVSPGSEEVCDGGFDNDCDTFADELDPEGAVGGVEAFEDLDGDGYGTAEAYYCNPPAGTTAAVGDDCDDADEEINPGAGEICGDSIDNNCDALIDDWCVVPLDTGDHTALGAADFNLAGMSVTAGDLNGDGTDDLIVGAPYSSSMAGSAHVVNGPVAGTTDLGIVASIESTGGMEMLAWDVEGGGDVDGDGTDDLLVGTWSVIGTGGVHIYTSGVLGTMGTADADIYLEEPEANDGFGMAFDSDFDTDSDGVSDIVVGAPYSGTGTTGKAFVYRDPLTSSVSAGDAALELQGTASDYLGIAVSGLGDVQGTGFDDYAVGAPGGSVFSGSSSGTGRVYLLPGGDLDTGVYDISAKADAELTGVYGDVAGWSVSPAGDQDSDGYDDLLVGAPFDNAGHGKVYLVAGPLSGTVALASSYATFTVGDLAGERLGSAVDGGGDVNADGAPDLLFGASGVSDTRLPVAGSGGAFVVLGPVASGAHDPMAEGSSLYYGTYNSLAGSAVSFVGDQDSDGSDEIVVGGPGHLEPGDTIGRGATWLWYGASL